MECKNLGIDYIESSCYKYKFLINCLCCNLTNFLYQQTTKKTTKYLETTILQNKIITKNNSKKRLRLINISRLVRT